MSIPVSLYEKLEQKFGRDEALEIAKMIEDFFDEMDRKAGEIALQRIDRLDLKLNLLILLVVIVLTVMNPVVAELLKKWFGIH